MRRALMLGGLILLLGGGVSTAVGLASGSSRRDTTTRTATSAQPAKVWLCHRTGSKKHPYHLIHVSVHAQPAHLRHGDVAPGAGNSCPTTAPAKPHGQSKPDTEKDD